MPKKFKIVGEVEVNDEGVGVITGNVTKLEIDQPPTPPGKKIQLRDELRPENVLPLFVGDGGLFEQMRATISPNKSSLYNTYYFMALRSLYHATGNVEYWDMFRLLVEDWLDLVAWDVETVTNKGQYPESGKTHLPWTGYGARKDVHYGQFEFIRNPKHIRHFATFSMPFLMDVIREDNDRSVQAESLADRVNRCSLEERFACYGWYNRQIALSVDNTFTNERKKYPRYWGSQVTLGITALAMLDNYADLAGVELPVLYIDYNGGTSIDYKYLYRTWAQYCDVNDDGSVTWDTKPGCGINENGMGWGSGFSDDISPPVNHSNRHANLVRFMIEAGYEKDNSDFVKGLVKTFEQRICLPDTYETRQGRHKGIQAGSPQMSNYITGSNGSFRINYGRPGGYLTESEKGMGSNEGMGSQCFFGWGQLCAPRSETARHHIYKLCNQVFEGFISKADPRHTGTYARHSSVFGKVGLLGIIAECQKLNGKLD